MISITFQLDPPIYILTVHNTLGKTAEETEEKLTEDISKLILMKCKTIAASASLNCLSFSVGVVPEQSQGFK